MNKIITLDQLRKDDLIIFEAIMGSNAYGTATPESDTDIRGVFIQPLNHILKYGFIDQVADEKHDIVFYELGRYLKLLQQNNPGALEMLVPPDDCVIYKSKEFSMIQKYLYDFLSKKVRYTFAGYAIEQIKKAKGYNKKMNWEEKQMTRKSVLDFCYVLIDSGSISLQDYLDRLNNYYPDYPGKSLLTYHDFGLTKIDHAHDIYAMYEMKGENAGIISDPETANDVKLTSIPKNRKITAYLTFNKDAYSSHCIKYKEYQTWLKERNPNRVRMNKDHGKNYDSKNMMHVFRLLSMAHEMAEGRLRVRRDEEEIEKLMKIRRGEYEYEDLIKEAEKMISGLDEAFEKSKLIKDVQEEFALSLLYSIRKEYYKLK